MIEVFDTDERNMIKDLNLIFSDIDRIEGNLDLSRLTSAEGLKLPENIGGYLDLSGLTSAEGLKLPENIECFLDLTGLTSAEGLKLPENIEGVLDLSRLMSAEGLKLPKNFDIKKLYALQRIKDEINNHPEKYYIQE